MRYLVAITLLLPLAGLAQGKYIHKGERDGVEMAYRWNHPTGKPSELLLRLKNTTQEDRHIALAIDLYYQGRTRRADGHRHQLPPAQHGARRGQGPGL